MLKSLVIVIAVFAAVHGELRIITRSRNVALKDIFRDDKNAVPGTMKTGCFQTELQPTCPDSVELKHKYNRLVVKLSPGITAKVNLYVSTLKLDYSTEYDAVALSEYVGQAQTIDVVLPGPATYYLGYTIVSGTMQHAEFCYATVQHRIIPDCGREIVKNEYNDNYYVCKLDLCDAWKYYLDSSLFNQMEVLFSSGALAARKDFPATLKRYDSYSEAGALFLHFDKYTEFIYLFHHNAEAGVCDIQFHYGFKPVQHPLPYATNPFQTHVLSYDCLVVEGEYKSNTFGEVINFPLTVKTDDYYVNEMIKIEFREKNATSGDFEFRLYEGQVHLDLREFVPFGLWYIPMPASAVASNGMKIETIISSLPNYRHDFRVQLRSIAPGTIHSGSLCWVVYGDMPPVPG